MKGMCAVSCQMTLWPREGLHYIGMDHVWGCDESVPEALELRDRNCSHLQRFINV
jgi:hypothetical protein